MCAHEVGAGRRACHISDVEEWVLFSFMWVPRVELGCQLCAAGAFTLIAQRTFLIQWILRLKKQKIYPSLWRQNGVCLGEQCSAPDSGTEIMALSFTVRSSVPFLAAGGWVLA